MTSLLYPGGRSRRGAHAPPPLTHKRHRYCAGGGTTNKACLLDRPGNLLNLAGGFIGEIKRVDTLFCGIWCYWWFSGRI